MNIAVQDINGRVYCRPDTTLEKENRDLYAPEFVEGYHYVPVVFGRICKAGKCVGEKFASRYYDSINYGILLYVSNMLEEGTAFASCTDHTSFLIYPMFNRYTLENGKFIVRKNGEEIYCTDEGSGELIEKAIVNITRKVSIRIGDFVVAELTEPQKLVSREEGVIALSGEYCENSTFDFKIFF